MEELIRSKIAQLEENFPKQAYEQKIIRDINLLENENNFDESELCLRFDSEVIDERKALDERIKNVRDLYIQEIQNAKKLEIECNNLFNENKACINRLAQITTEHSQKKKELKTQEEIKSKLHEMCRLLQRQAKEIVADNDRQIELEKARMTELTKTFTETIAGISVKIAEQEELAEKQASENLQLRTKLAEFQEHTKLRDSHFKSQLHAKDLEFQLIEARRVQEAQLLKQEKLKAESYRNDITKLTNSKIELKNQLTLYSDKFDHFQEALTRSQKMFLQFEDKMNTMEVTVEKLENLNTKLKLECNKYDCELLEQLQLKEEGSKIYQALQQEKTKLGNECRILQTKRVELVNKLNNLKNIKDQEKSNNNDNNNNNNNQEDQEEKTQHTETNGIVEETEIKSLG